MISCAGWRQFGKTRSRDWTRKGLSLRAPLIRFGEPEADLHARVGAAELQLACVPDRDLADDGKAEAAALGGVDLAEPLQRDGQLLRRKPAAIIAYRQNCAPGFGPNGDMDARQPGATMLQGVVDQVLDDFFQHHRVRGDEGRSVRLLEVEGDVLGEDPLRVAPCDPGDERVQVDRAQGVGAGPLDPLERQYLGRQARRPGRSGGKFIKTLDTLPVRRGIPGRLGKGQHADDRIAQPMRRVGDEHVACPHGLVDLTEERIQARDALCIAASGGIAKLTTIKFTLLAPFLFMLISFAAFQSGQNLMDLVTLFSIGLIGIPLRRFDSSRPAFPIGCVQAESA